MSRLQRSALSALLGIGATAEDKSVAKTVAPQQLDQMALGALRAKGLVQSKVVKGKGRQWTQYWLTEEGVARAGMVGVS